MHGERLIVFADYACPFCCLADHEMRRGRREGRLHFEGAAFELRPAGTPLPDPAAPALVEAWRTLVEPLAAELGVAMRRPSRSVRTRKAHEAAAYARSAGMFEAMHEAIYTAYWEEDRDIGRIDVLVEIGAGVGLDATDLRVALDIDQWTVRVMQDETWAALHGIDAVPAYIRTAAPDDARIGLQREHELTAWMEQVHDI